MTYYCKYHDILLCEKHKESCLGRENCTPNLKPAQEQTWCSVCEGIIRQ